LSNSRDHASNINAVVALFGRKRKIGGTQVVLSQTRGDKGGSQMTEPDPDFAEEAATEPAEEEDDVELHGDKGGGGLGGGSGHKPPVEGPAPS
jgi:hypothetical protein